MCLERKPRAGGDGAPPGRHFATPTRGTGLGGEAPPPGAAVPGGGRGAGGERPTPWGLTRGGSPRCALRSSHTAALKPLFILC